MRTFCRLIAALGIYLICSVFMACEHEKIEVYNADRYLSFETNIDDTLTFSFFFTLEEEYDYPIVVNLSGDLLEEDREFLVKVDDASTLESSMYSLPERFIFRKGLVSDTIRIRLKNHENLQTEELLLKLRIENSESFKSAGDIWGYSILSVSDIAVKPDWWDDVIDRSYLGSYSKKKFELLMEATGISDMSEMGDGDKRIVALKFKHWLGKQDPIPDVENGGFISVPVIG